MIRTYFEETAYDMPVDVAQKYAEGIRMALLSGRAFDKEKRQGYYLSRNRGFDDKLYVGNIHSVEQHLRWNDEELQDDDQIINVVMVDGPITRDGDGCSYGSKDHREQIMYANTLPQVIGHLFIINTPGGASSARIDYEQAIEDCREKGKYTVAWVDGMCCSAGQLLASLCDRTICMAGRDTMGCIGTMCAFWGVAHNTVSRDGYRYIELVSVTSPDKNAEYREATAGDTDKLQAELDRLGEEFRATVRANRPLVKEEHLTGKTFDANDVMGALVDEIGSYSRAIQAVFDLAEKKLTPARFVTEMPKGDGQEIAKPANANAEKDENDNNNDNEKHNEMTDEERKAAEAEAAMAAQKENPGTQENPEAQEQENLMASLNEELAEKQGIIEKQNGEISAKDAEISKLSADNESLGKTVDEQKTTIAGHEATIEEQKATIEEQSKQMTEKDAEIESQKQALAEKEAEIESQKQALAEKDAEIESQKQALAEKEAEIESQKQALAEKEAEIKELSEDAGNLPAGGGIPADNGAGEAPKGNGIKSIITPGMSPAEIREALRRQDDASKTYRR